MPERNGNLAIEEMQPLDIEVVKWQLGHHGDFYRSVYRCIASADDINLEKIRTLFKVPVEAFIAWTRDPNYREELLAKMRKSNVWRGYADRF